MEDYVRAITIDNRNYFFPGKEFPQIQAALVAGEAFYVGEIWTTKRSC